MIALSCFCIFLFITFFTEQIPLSGAFLPSRFGSVFGVDRSQIYEKNDFNSIDQGSFFTPIGGFIAGKRGLGELPTRNCLYERKSNKNK